MKKPASKPKIGKTDFAKPVDMYGMAGSLLYVDPTSKVGINKIIRWARAEVREYEKLIKMFEKKLIKIKK